MKFTRMMPLAGVSLLALSSALHAEEKKQEEVTVLDTITIINQGRENVVATGARSSRRTSWRS